MPKTFNQLQPLLKTVSRSFYLTLWVLPGAIRPQIGLAYMLARITDTIADTDLIPADQRLSTLRLARERIASGKIIPLNLSQLAQHQRAPAERTLLERGEEALRILDTFAPEDKARIRAVLETITSGQELDLTRFSAASTDSIVSLRNDAELDDYTYRVAGCVGEFWTRICRARLFPKANLDDGFLLENGIRFGKGLQLINILRDVAADIRIGRCYLPSERLAACGLKPADLLMPENESRLRPLFEDYLADAESFLADGWRYTNALPRRSFRVRLACAWPILIGQKTIEALRAGNVLDPSQRIRIRRAEVRAIIARTILLYPLPGIWQRLHRAQPVSPSRY